MLQLRLVLFLLIIGSTEMGMAQSESDAQSAKVDEVVRAQMREQKIPGVSLAVIRDGKIIKATGYGLANVELNVPMAPQMVFHSGSLAKAFTATAVMMLVEEGKIGLDDKISKYLPDAPNPMERSYDPALAHRIRRGFGIILVKTATRNSISITTLPRTNWSTGLPRRP